MLTTRRVAVLIPIINVLLFYGWISIFSEDEWWRTFEASIFPVIGCIITLFWITKAYNKLSSESRYFWLHFGIGILFYLSGSLLWFYTLVLKGVLLSPDISYLLWLLAYVFFLLGLLYKTKTISTSVSNSPYFFNIIVFMTAATAISIHYIINPIWDLSENSLIFTIVKISVPIIDLSILFLITYLYYISKYTRERKLTLLLVIAFFILIVADSAFVYLLEAGIYKSGSFIDPFWLISIMLIGIGAIYAQSDTTKNTWKFEKHFEDKEILFPYASAVILLFLVVHSYQWKINALSVGVIFIFLMLIIRQLLVMKKNKNLITEYRYLAYHDSLTGLNNRVSFNEDFSKCLEKAKQNNYKIGLLVIDLDRFKLVNDTLGHYTGDMLLKSASERLKQIVKINYRIYRLGGDEFVIILPGTTEKQCVNVAEEIIQRFGKPFIVDNHDITITTSIGISLYPMHGETSEQLLKNADAAMYLAKGNGRDNYCFYNSDLNKILSRKMKIENDLRKAIENKQLTLFYQPIVELQSRKTVGMEALLRWEHPEMGSISPGEFIPIAEDTGQIVSIGEWVLRTACKQNRAWQDAGFTSLCVSVNVSVRQFQDKNFIKTVKDTLLDTGLRPQFLELEITESIMQNVKESILVLKQLRDLGVHTAIDDFGTGYSSLHILKELPIDTIKIDKLFIDDVSDLTNHSIVKTIIDIGLNLDLRVIAEGIEYEQQASTLTQYKCLLGQGYLFLKPVSAEEFESFFTNRYQLKNHVLTIMLEGGKNLK